VPGFNLGFPNSRHKRDACDWYLGIFNRLYCAGLYACAIWWPHSLPIKNCLNNLNRWNCSTRMIKISSKLLLMPFSPKDNCNNLLNNKTARRCAMPGFYSLSITSLTDGNVRNFFRNERKSFYRKVLYFFSNRRGYTIQHYSIIFLYFK